MANPVVGTLQSDGFVRGVLRPILLLALTAMIVANAAIVYVYYNVVWDMRAATPLTHAIVGWFLNLRGVPTSIGSPVLQIVTAAIAVLCFPKDRPYLNWFGRVTLLFVLGLVVAAGVASIVSPSDVAALQNIPRVDDGSVTVFAQIAQGSVTAGWSYFGVLTGLSVALRGTGEPNVQDTGQENAGPGSAPYSEGRTGEEGSESDGSTTENQMGDAEGESETTGAATEIDSVPLKDTRPAPRKRRAGARRRSDT